MRHASLKNTEEVGMRGDESIPDDLLSYVRPEQRVPAEDPPLCPDPEDGGRGAGGLSPGFSGCTPSGAPSIAPEKLLRALLLQALYTIRSERQLMEQLDFNLLYRWLMWDWTWTIPSGM